jgi:hypothetical protein
LAEADPLVVDLIELGRYIEFPPTPNFAVGFEARLRSDRRNFSRLALLGLAAALVVAGAGLGSGVVASWIGLGHVRVQTTSHPPQITPTPGGVVDQLKASGATQMSLAEARSRTGGLPILPANLPEPDGVYVATSSDLDIVYVVYRPLPDLPATLDAQVGLLLTEFTAGPGDQMVLDKLLGTSAKVTSVVVNGVPGYWIEGAEHFTAPADEPAAVRVSSDVLIWEKSGRLTRMEVAVSKERAIAIAESIAS